MKHFLALTVIILIFSSQPLHSQVLEQDSLALVDLYNATNGAGWANQSNWLQPGKKVGDWYGISLTGNRVSSINLDFNNLTGTIPNTIGNLTALIQLNINANHLAGAIPESIGNLTKLVFLGLVANALSGEIPATLANCTALVFLHLEDNSLTGPIPTGIFTLPTCKQIVLSFNELTGTLPATIGSMLSDTHDLVLDHNHLTGEIPASLWSNSSLQYVALENNEFTSVSRQGAFKPSLTILTLDNNKLDFASLEPFLTAGGAMPATFVYSPQAPIYTTDEITLHTSARLILRSTTGGSFNQYQWLKDNNTIPSATDPDLTNVLTLADDGVYKAAVTNTIATALTLQRQPVTLHMEDRVLLNCTATNMLLEAAVTDPQATFLWSTGATTRTITVNTSGKYGVRIETQNYLAEDTIEVFIPAALSLGPDIVSCSASIVLSANVPGAGTYQWLAPDGSSGSQDTFTATASGTYSISITQPGCTGTFTDDVDVTLEGENVEGSFVIMAGNTPIEDGGVALRNVPLTFINTTAGGTTTSWSFGDQTVAQDQEAKHAYTQEGTYTVTLAATDQATCPVTAEQQITIRDIMITTAISPNGDGKNDTWYVTPFNDGAELKVVDRKGRTVYEASSYSNDFSGQGLEEGIYFYDLYFKDINQRYKGHFQIIK